jgi:hypothetical protein
MRLYLFIEIVFTLLHMFGVLFFFVIPQVC